MNDIQEAIERVESNEQFATMAKDRYLVHFFCFEKDGTGAPEVGYYHPEDDTIVVFTIDPFGARPPEPALKESGVLARLDQTEVEIDFAKAKEIATSFHEEKYPAHPVTQAIWILQQTDVPLWNITLITETLNMHLLRIDGVSGEVRTSELRNILDLRAKTGE